MKTTTRIRSIAVSLFLPFAPTLVHALETHSVASASRPVTEEVVGSVRTRIRSVIEAKVSGRISEMPIILGQKVKAGELLAKIDAREIQARLEQAEAQREQASRDLDRARTLAQKQVSSKQELDAAEARARRAPRKKRRGRRAAARGGGLLTTPRFMPSNAAQVDMRAPPPNMARVRDALGLSLSAINCGMSDSTSLGACSRSIKSQSNPATPMTSAVMGLPSESQLPMRVRPSRSARRKLLGNAR